MNVDLTGAVWFKSTRSSTGKECVEVAHLKSGMVGLRDSKNPTGPALIFGPDGWDAFLTGVAAGKFNPLS